MKAPEPPKGAPKKSSGRSYASAAAPGGASAASAAYRPAGVTGGRTKRVCGPDKDVQIVTESYVCNLSKAKRVQDVQDFVERDVWSEG
ncbi:hypothetical protein AC249_AIPGENE20166 [Exaiptasia diaphana]|nr:hypothetical protein AC249_AIPGENE20166 [Exaiptasia diaphana]